ncbi:hypothetical protein MRB53_038305 [Persea americana]|nr:hypothetical protein MRB53_038305 [Persea americana]
MSRSRGVTPRCDGSHSRGGCGSYETWPEWSEQSLRESPAVEECRSFGGQLMGAACCHAASWICSRSMKRYMAAREHCALVRLRAISLENVRVDKGLQMGLLHSLAAAGSLQTKLP